MTVMATQIPSVEKGLMSSDKAGQRLHVLVACAPLWGHLLPAIRVSAGLVARGHRVTLMTSAATAERLQRLPECEGMQLVLVDDYPTPADVDKFFSLENPDFSKPDERSERLIREAVGRLLDGGGRVDYCVVDFMSFRHIEIVQRYNLPFVINVPGPDSALGLLGDSNTNTMMSVAMTTVMPMAVMLKQYLGINTTAGAMGTLLSQVRSHCKGHPKLLHSTPSLSVDEHAAASMPSHVQLIGHVLPPSDPAKTLRSSSPALADFVEAEDETPVIVVTLGSMLSTLSIPKVGEIIKAVTDPRWKTVVGMHKGVLEHIPEEAKQHPNLYLDCWIPQAQLLSHPRVKLVVTHCGWGGSMEVINGGKPFVGLPSFGDQPYNAKLLQAKGLGVHHPIKSVSAQKLNSSIARVLADPSYAAAAEKLRESVAAESGGPAQAARWIEEQVASPAVASCLRPPGSAAGSIGAAESSSLWWSRALSIAMAVGVAGAGVGASYLWRNAKWT